MGRQYRQDRKVRPTSSRADAAANRHLQLVGGTGFTGGKGKTLTEKMGDELDRALKERGERMQDYQHQKDQLPDGETELSDDDENDHLDWMLESEGYIKGCLRMLAIMRSTTPKKELERARIRIQYGQEEK